MLIKVQNLEAGYKNAKVLHGINLNVAEGQSVAILGPNGAGKTTLLNTLAGTLTATAGNIEFAGKDITKLESHKRARSGLALSPEGRKVFAAQSVIDNLKLAGAFTGHSKSIPANLEKVYALFPRLKERANQIAGTLSGGEQQMLAIARALMTQPSLLMLDEPSLGLAPKIVTVVFEALAELKKTGLSMVIVEQFAHRALAVVDHAYALNHGEIVDVGLPQEFDEKRLHAAYLK